jgi:hypothetical protein
MSTFNSRLAAEKKTLDPPRSAHVCALDNDQTHFREHFG